MVPNAIERLDPYAENTIIQYDYEIPGYAARSQNGFLWRPEIMIAEIAINQLASSSVWSVT